MPNNSNESEDQASCLIVAFCAVPTSNSDGIETLQTLESNLKRRGVKLLVVDTSGRDQPPSSCSSSGSNKKESVSKACTAMGISIVSLHKLVHALSFLPPKVSIQRRSEEWDHNFTRAHSSSFMISSLLQMILSNNRF